MEIISDLKKFFEQYNLNEKIVTWTSHCKTFREIWEKKISKGKANKQDFDDLVFIIDCNARGSTKQDEAVARTYIRYPIWYKLFDDLNTKQELCNSINELFNISEQIEKIEKINEIYKMNENNKNGLTTKSAIILNALLFLNKPQDYLSSLSIKHRSIICSKLRINYSNSSDGHIIIESNDMIINHFKEHLDEIGILKNIEPFIVPRFISDFIYSNVGRNYFWQGSNDNITANDYQDLNYSDQTFYLEKYLENFIYTNWEKIKVLGKDYEFITNTDNEPISLQYKTDVGNIDLLVRNKNDKHYLVIELKRSRTSDQTIGQITRYMGWVKENLAKNENVDVKGLIIAEAFDDRIQYSLKYVSHVDLLSYKINFDLHYEKRS